METSATTASPTASAVTPPLDLSKALPYLLAIYRWSTRTALASFHLAYRLSKSAALLAHSSFFSHVVGATLYLCAPLIVFGSLVFQAFVIAPYTTITWILDLAYPVYVLVGVACIVGGIVGGVARLAAQFAVEQSVPGEVQGAQATLRSVEKQRSRPARPR
ncbi:uncharacterized protein SCHCODRAFT_02644438 [Schizophyllum commune H4-8]|nr:uncharacterized protein SCHCODRAFT_02644438 [Schizophyllum commune H4-8]KAI5885325.1 hypothetical protein SCHCODRAFT_02644438 [Schizophyllum commune H4-8]